MELLGETGEHIFQSWHMWLPKAGEGRGGGGFFIKPISASEKAIAKTR